MREIRYASLLHDFGKVGVKEQVLVKEKKLYPYDLEHIRQRIHFIKRSYQYETSNNKLRYILEKNRNATLEELSRFDRDEADALAEIDNYLQAIVQANEPAILDGGSFDRLLTIAQKTYKDIQGNNKPLLTPDEITALSIRKGSLDMNERKEIESHVTHTFKFLSQIPWTDELHNVPEIAYAHHEKLNGNGYPNNLHSHEIPVQSKIMSISDIFDALTASDRPYKKAVPVVKALDILNMEIKDNHIDPELTRLFIEAQVYKSVL